MKTKYNVTVTGNKNALANGLWRVRHSAIETKDLEKIHSLLPKAEKHKVDTLLKQRRDHPITNYRGMWEERPKPLAKMPRAEVKRRLQAFRDAWENITTRNQDLSDERLDSETLKDLRDHLKFYYSKDAKMLAEDWLRV